MKKDFKKKLLVYIYIYVVIIEQNFEMKIKHLSSINESDKKDIISVYESKISVLENKIQELQHHKRESSEKRSNDSSKKDDMIRHLKEKCNV